MRHSAFPAIYGLVGLMVQVAPVEASPFDLYGAGARGSAMAAQTADAAGAAALYYNVAALTRSSAGVTFGAAVGFDQASILLHDRPAGYDIPNLGSQTPTIPSELELRPRSDTNGLGTFYTMTIGAVTNLGTERFRAGMLLAMPVGGAASTWFVDERERLFSNRLHWSVIGERARRMDIELGLAWEPLDRISFGAGMTLLPSVRVDNDVYVANPTDQENVDINLTQSTGLDWGFTLGALWEVTETIRIGLAYRHDVGFGISGENELQIRGLEDEDEGYPTFQTLELQPNGSPAIASLGGAADIGRATVSADLIWTRWSRWVDTHGVHAGFEDTVSPRMGLEYASSDNTDLRLGFGYDPTPVPEQDGRTNHVDNDRFRTSVGARHGFTIADRSLEVSWFLQFHLLPQRETNKRELLAWPGCGAGVESLCDEVRDDLTDPRTGNPVDGVEGLQTGNPGFPGWVSGGWLAAAGIEGRWSF
jgi:hypothetical protein